MPSRGENLGVVVPRVPRHIKVTPRKNGSGALCEFTDRPGARRVEIDPIGLEVLRRVDGRKGVGALIEIFARDHKLTPLEARAMILTYLRALTQRGIVVMEKTEA